MSLRHTLFFYLVILKATFRKHQKSAVFRTKLQGSNFASYSSVLSVLKWLRANSNPLIGFTFTISLLPKRKYMAELFSAPVPLAVIY